MDAGSHLASWALAAPHIPRAGIFTHQLLNFSQMQKILSEIYMNALNYGASLIDQLVKNPPVMWETWVRSLGWEDPLEEGKGYLLQYSGLENSMDCIVLGVAKNWTQLSNFHFTHFEL